MERLPSCYFCGAAPDQPLATYRVADQLATSPAGTAITLCPTCHRKLDALFEETGTGAVESDRAAGEANPNHGAGTAGRDERAPDHGGRPPDGERTPDTPNPNRSAGTRSSAGSQAGSDADQTADEAPGLSSEQSGTGEPRVPGDTGSSDDHSDTGEARYGPETGDAGRPSDTGEAGHESETSEAESRRGEAGHGPEAGDPGSGRRDTAGSPERATGEASGREPSVSKREYRKVLRLLQNREEAVDRSELVDLATSAYGLTPAGCAKILDVAIERGHIEQRGTELVLLD